MQCAKVQRLRIQTAQFCIGGCAQQVSITAGFYSAFAFGVSSGGVIAGSGNSGQYSVNNTNMGGVPAFKFNPKTPTLAKGSKIEFGSYPQSEVTDADEVAKLEADSENYLWVSYKYYSGTGDRTDGKMESGDFML